MKIKPRSKHIIVRCIGRETILAKSHTSSFTTSRSRMEYAVVHSQYWTLHLSAAREEGKRLGRISRIIHIPAVLSIVFWHFIRIPNTQQGGRIIMKLARQPSKIDVVYRCHGLLARFIGPKQVDS